MRFCASPAGGRFLDAAGPIPSCCADACDPKSTFIVSTSHQDPIILERIADDEGAEWGRILIGFTDFVSIFIFQHQLSAEGKSAV